MAGLFNLTIGFLDGAHAGDANNLDVCRDAISEQWWNTSIRMIDQA